MQLLTHPCAECGTLLQYRAASGEMPYKCPICGREAFLPPTPRPEDEIVKKQLDAAAAALEKVRKVRKRWRRMRRGLTVLCFCAAASLLVVSVGLVGYIHIWLSGLWAWPDSGSGAGFLAVIGLLLGLIDLVSYFAYPFFRQAPRSAGLRPLIKANVAFGVLRNLACLGNGLAVLAFGLAPGTAGARIALVLAGVLFLVQWTLQGLLLRALAHAKCSAYLLRKLHDFLFLLGCNVLVGAVMLASWPKGGPPPAITDWPVTMMASFLGLMSAILTWLCFASYLRITLALRMLIDV
jgi:hypothetical protein